MADTNPLSSGRKPDMNREHPLMRHAKLAAYAHSMAPHELPAKSDLAGYVTPILGTLASDPNVNSKDVVKAAAGAVADGKITAAEAVKFLSTVPEDPAQLHPWLKNLYATNMTALVHMKAAMMKNGVPLQPRSAAPVSPGAAPPVSPVVAPGQPPVSVPPITPTGMAS